MPGPLRDDLGDVLGVDLLLQEGGLAVLLRLQLGEALLELGDLAVAQLGGALQVGVALGALDLAVRLLEALLDLAHGADRVLLGLPLGLHPRRALAQLGQLALDRLAALLGGLVLLLAQRLALDLELHHAALDLVDLGRQRVDLDPQLRGGLVDQVDRLVGQEAVRDVAVRERGRGDDRGVLDAHAVMHLVALLEAAQDRDRVLDRGLADEHGLEAALQRRVLLDVLAVLVQRGRADRAQLAARQHRLEQVGRVDGALGAARADDRVQLVDEEDHRALASEISFSTAFSRSSNSPRYFGAGDQRADVERDHAAVAQRLGHVAETMRWARPSTIAVLPTPGSPIRTGLFFVRRERTWITRRISSSRPITGSSLPCSAACGEIAAELLQRLVLVLGVLVGDAVRAAHLGDRLQQRVVRRAGVAQRVAGLGLRRGQRQQQVLGGDVLVAELAGLLLGRAQHLDDVAARPRARPRRR